MIAANYRKHPEAMALQLVLHFGRALVWALPQPSTRILRAIRAARGAAFKAAGRLQYPEKQPVPQWWRNAQTARRRLAQNIKAMCLDLMFADISCVNGNQGGAADF